MPKIIRANINPNLLIWARESAGYSQDEVASKMRIRADRLIAWENGELAPTIKQLRKLGRIYKRPLAVFYLPEPPKDFQPMSDYRRFAGTYRAPVSVDLKYQIRLSQERREIALQLHEELGYEFLKYPTVSLDDNPEMVAKSIREIFDITIQSQTRCATDYEALWMWRDAVEKQDILVFQATGVDMNEMRGCSISDLPLPAIILNNKDSRRGRIFTLIHEYVHIMLRNGGLCDLTDDSNLPPEKQRVEIFCNMVAGATIFPATALSGDKIISSKTEKSNWTMTEIRSIANRYFISREVVLRRLLIFDKITAHLYSRFLLDIDAEHRASDENEEKRSYFVPRFRITLSTAGHLFIRLALNSYYQEKITSSELSGYLNTKLNHMAKIEQEVMGRNIEFRTKN